MANETKKRLLLSKWRGSRTEVAKLRAEVKELEDARDEAWKDVTSLQDDRNALQSQLDEIEGPGMREALESVRWFFLDPLVHHRPMTDPRAILRKIEDVL